MEITLNLLPPHLLQQREVQRRKRTRTLALAAAVLPIVLVYAVLNARIQVLQVRAASLDRQVAALSPVADKARKLETDLAALRRREDALNRLTVRLPHWSASLAQLSSLVPQDVWFTSLSITDGQLVIAGQALSESAVSTLTARLAGARFLTGTSLKFVREGSVGTRRVFTFEMSGTLRAEGQSP